MSLWVIEKSLSAFLRCSEGRDWHIADKPIAPGFVAYWTNNGQRWISARVVYDAIDPKRTSAVHCGNGFDVGFRPYQSTRLNL
jgi:hypothetical protein